MKLKHIFQLLRHIQDRLPATQGPGISPPAHRLLCGFAPAFFGRHLLMRRAFPLPEIVLAGKDFAIEHGFPVVHAIGEPLPLNPLSVPQLWQTVFRRLREFIRNREQDRRYRRVHHPSPLSASWSSENSCSAAFMPSRNPSSRVSCTAARNFSSRCPHRRTG